MLDSECSRRYICLGLCLGGHLHEAAKLAISSMATGPVGDRNEVGDCVIDAPDHLLEVTTAAGHCITELKLSLFALNDKFFRPPLTFSSWTVELSLSARSLPKLDVCKAMPHSVVEGLLVALKGR